MPREWDWVCVVPVAGPVHVFEGLLATIEDDLLPGFLFVDNSRDSFLRDYDLKGARVVYHPENLGVAKSWNLALREGHEQTIIRRM